MLHANHCIFWQRLHNFIPWFVGPSVCQSIHPLVHHIALFWRFFSLRPQGSCPNALMTSNTAPALPHINWLAMYSVYAFSFFFFFLLTCYVTLQPAMSVHLSVCPLVGWFVGHLFGQRPQRGRWPMLSHRGIFSSSSFSSSFSVFPPPTFRPISQPWSPYTSLDAQIPILRSKSQPQGANLIL